MTIWNDQWATMRAQFLVRAKDRLAKLADMLDQWDRSKDPELLYRVYKEFHWLAGVGGTYQLPEVSALGGNGELICMELVERKRELANDDAQRLRDILASVTSVIESQG